MALEVSMTPDGTDRTRVRVTRTASKKATAGGGILQKWSASAGSALVSPQESIEK
jgi:hypothetical protein